MGRWLEARAKGQAGAAIRALIELAPDHATLLRDGKPVQVAVDGIVIEGRGHIDESMLTGEPVPAENPPETW